MPSPRRKWEPRTREDFMLRSYLRRLRRDGPLGAVHVEVPFGRDSGGTARRLDAVRFSHRDNRIRRFETEAFQQDLPGRAPIELIEVKPELNRPVIGQLVAAEILVRDEWRLSGRRLLRLVAVVTWADPALHLACRRLGIRVEVVRKPTAAT